jgi:superfamily I DNA and/or RNA helicase
VLLSLVRSNAEGSVGFTAKENRTIVALSRAKEGFFIVGNGGLFSRHQAWEPVIKMLTERGGYGERLPLVCSNHKPPSTTLVRVRRLTSC